MEIVTWLTHWIPTAFDRSYTKQRKKKKEFIIIDSNECLSLFCERIYTNVEKEGNEYMKMSQMKRRKHRFSRKMSPQMSKHNHEPNKCQHICR